MPFDTAVKTAMFTRCNRHCCLCRKQCGLNIEAAHIIDEAAGGTNEEENGIPLCFDCHQEIGSYNDKHPRGNKFRPEELRARRDQVYKLVAEGRLADLTAAVKQTHRFPNPLHQIIDLLSKYHGALGRVHHAKTRDTRDESLEVWRSCHPAVWDSGSGRDDTIRKLADPAKEWLSQINSPYVHSKDFNLIEEGARILSGFAISPSPMSMPEIYSNESNTEDELWQRWNGQGDQLMALGGLIARLRDLTARAGQMWNPPAES